MVKDELLKEHKKTWKDNGLSDLKYTKKEEEKIHSSNLAVKITVALPLNGHWSDTKTEWGERSGKDGNASADTDAKVNGSTTSFSSQWAGAGTNSSNKNSNDESLNPKLAELSNVKEHSKGIPTVRKLTQLHTLCVHLKKACKRINGGIIRDRKLFQYLKKISINGELNDDEIYSKLHEFYWKDREMPKESQTELNSGGKNFDRFGDRAQTIKDLVEDSLQLKGASSGVNADDEDSRTNKPKIIRRGAGRKNRNKGKKKQNVIEKKRASNMLDVGCAEGGITANVGRALGLDPRNVHGCDVREVKKEDDGFQFLKYDGTVLPEANYPKDNFDVVTCLMALHHMVLQNEIIQSIYRVLKPGGVCIIREHDCSEDSVNFNGEIALAIDVQHAMYARVLSNPVEWPTFCNDYYAKYRPRETWTNMFKAAGFEHVKTVRPDLYEAHGSSNWYWAVYRK